MGNKLKRAVGKAVLTLTCISMALLFNIPASAYWTNQTTYGNQTLSCSGASQNQSGTVTLPSGAYAYYASTDNGSASFSQSGGTVTVNTSGGTGSTVSSQVWDATKYSKTASATADPQSSQTFPSTYPYNDGIYSGTLNQSGSANLVSGLPADSKTATYDETCTYDATATITSIENGTIYFSWYYPSVDMYYSYTDSQGYIGTLTFTGFNNATYVSSTFNFPTPNYVGQTSTGTCTHVFHYSGTVTRPDTRQWTMNYSGTAYAGGYDTVTSTVYNYNVTVYYYTVSSIWVQDNTPPDGNATLSPSGVTSGNVVNAMSRETVPRQYIDGVKKNYDFILIDCMPSLGMMTVNALTAANSVLIPVQAEYLPVKGLEQLIQTIGKVRRQLNPRLKIEGILITMVNERTNYSKDIISLLHGAYGKQLHIFENNIPLSVRAAEISAEGKSIYVHDPHGKVAQAYEALTEEVMQLEKQRKKHKTDLIR